MPIRSTRRVFLATLLAAPLALRAEDGTLRLEGYAVEPRARVADVDLLLNGTGVRAVAWFKGFTAALYLKERASAADQAVAVPGPKRLQLRMLQEVASVEFAKAFRKGVERNVDPDHLPRLAERMARFEELINALGKVRKGDLINLDLEPGRGTLLSVNGTLRGAAIAGDDFYAGLLRSFVGDKPYDPRLKAGLLGLPA